MLIDNKNHGKVITELKKSLGTSSKFAVLSGMFSIYGYSALKKELGSLADVRLLLSKWDDASLHTIAGTPQETRLKNKLEQSRIAKECAAWVKKNTQTKAMTGQMAFPPHNMFHVSNPDDAFVIQGASHFTGTGLGEVKSDSFEINMGISDTETTKQLLQWFDTIWNDGKATQNIKDELIAHLEYLASEKPANLVYFITLYNIFKDYLEDIDEESIIRSKTGFKDTVVWNKLYKFQCDGVMGAIDKLEKYNGCIIADSVGLGKTFEALAVIKYYELGNDRVLVLAPKKLRENWTVYTINDKRNLLATDRFNYDVLNHTDLSRDKGKSGEIIPEGFATIANFKDSGIAKRKRRILLSASFAIPVLCAAILSYFFLRDQSEIWKMAALIVTAGLLTVASIEDMIREAHEKTQDSRISILFFVGGFALFTFVASI